MTIGNGSVSTAKWRFRNILGSLQAAIRSRFLCELLLPPPGGTGSGCARPNMACFHCMRPRRMQLGSKPIDSQICSKEKIQSPSDSTIHASVSANNRRSFLLRALQYFWKQ
jgi:hypothetical protein